MRDNETGRNTSCKISKNTHSLFRLVSYWGPCEAPFALLFCLFSRSKLTQLPFKLSLGSLPKGRDAGSNTGKKINVHSTTSDTVSVLKELSMPKFIFSQSNVLCFITYWMCDAALVRYGFPKSLEKLHMLNARRSHHTVYILRIEDF